MNSQQAKASLQQTIWEENKIFSVVEAPYRYRMVVHCSSLGRQKAMFANGEHSYFCYTEHLDGHGQWSKDGASIVPVLPDGHFIMVIEQRPAQSRYPNRPMLAKINEQSVDLNTFGQYSSLEFPGGSADINEGFKAAFLRELQEETNIPNQTALCYFRCHPIHTFGSDVAKTSSMGVIFLSGFRYDKYVQNDGGLVVFGLTKEEVEWNIYHGVIHSAQAALTPWAFYKEVEQARNDPSFEAMLQEAGYLAIEEIHIAKAK